MLEYIVLLKDVYYVKLFEQYLLNKYIPYEFLEFVNNFIIKCNENQAKEIEKLDYVVSIVKNTSYNSNVKEVSNSLEDIGQISNRMLKNLNYVPPYPESYGNWGIDRMYIPCLWKQGYTGQNVKVAVLDSGYQPHDRLDVVESVSFVPGEGPIDVIGHGTAVLGELGLRYAEAKIVGVCFDADLYSAKIIRAIDGKIEVAAFLKALNWCGQKRVDIVNLSVGIMETLEPYTKQSLEVAIQTLIGKGVYVVAASGNDGVGRVSFPASLRGVYGVGSTDKEDKRAVSSNYGKELFAVAPGVEIMTSGLNNSYVLESGTSFACPQLTGLIALIKSSGFSGNMTKLLIDAIQPISPEIEYGNGLVLAPRALTITSMVNSRVAYPTDSQNDMVFVARDEKSEPIVDVDVDLIITTPSNEQIRTTGKTNKNGELRINVNTNSSNNRAKSNQLDFNEVGTYKVEATARKLCNYQVSIPDKIEVIENEFSPYIVQKQYYGCSVKFIVLIKDKGSKVVSDANVEIIQENSCGQEKTIGFSKSNSQGIAYVNGCVINSCVGCLKMKVSKKGFKDYYTDISM